MNRNLNAYFKYANKIYSKYVITIGEKEVKNKIYNIKDLNTGIENIYDEINLLKILKEEK